MLQEKAGWRNEVLVDKGNNHRVYNDTKGMKPDENFIDKTRRPGLYH